MTRALLLFNPEATTVTPRVRDVIAHALDDVVSLEVAETKRRDHATELARDAVASGADMVFCLGGDGTLNETINGLAGTDVVLAILPGGGTNVYARSLGLPRDPVETTSVLIERIREGRAPRRVNLGTLNGRRFAFCAGVGFDAEVVRDVHRNFRRKQRLGERYFVTTAVRTYFLRSDRRHTTLRIDHPAGTIEGARVAIVGKSDPYTFLGSKPFRLTPRASAAGGLDLVTLSATATPTILRTVLGGFRGGRHLRMRAVTYLHDAERIEVTSARPVAVQADGEYLGEMVAIRFGVERSALSVL